ncbi:MAG: hypothetical protein AAF411_18675, partial [Myxococcota bacterium]
ALDRSGAPNLPRNQWWHSYIYVDDAEALMNEFRAAGIETTGGRESYARGTWYNSAKLFDIEYTTAGLVNMKQPDEREWFYEERGDVRSTTRIVLSGEKVIGFNLLGRRWDHEVLIRFIEEERDLSYVLDHLNEANFDTEFVAPLDLARARAEAAE